MKPYLNQHQIIPRPMSHDELLARAESMHRRLNHAAGPWFTRDLAKAVLHESQNLRNTLKFYHLGMYNITEVLTSRRNLMACMLAIQTYRKALPKHYEF